MSCFIIIFVLALLKLLRYTFFYNYNYYFIFQDWLRLMRQCTYKKLNVSRSEVQQIRSLGLQIKECRLTKPPHTQIFCRIAVDSCFVARTRQISDEQPCIFEDSYRFE